MCGIAARFSPGQVAAPLPFWRLRHRGPDALGEWRSADGACWLGHTRLAILDLSANGAQPMVALGTGDAIVFNGEIYNHRALRARLPEEAGSWRGGSDTETLLAGYRRWGRALPERLKGMFAFAIYDAGKGALLVARDRFGMKPLYYTWGDGVLSLASEVRTLLEGRGGGTSPEAVSAYLSTGACPEECLPWGGIQCLPPGHTLWLGADGHPAVERFWFPAGRRSRPFPDPVARVRELLEDSVEDHLQSDVPVASFLSGGLDSSVITALAARKLSRRLLTFSVGFSQRGLDETAVAAAVARRHGTEHHRIELSVEEMVSLVREAVGGMDLPSVDAINTYIVARVVARSGVKVALTGLGGDELFGGYPVFRECRRLQWLARLPRGIRAMMVGGGSRGRRLSELPGSDAGAIARWRRRFLTGNEAEKAGLPPHGLGAEASGPGLPDDFARVSWSELTGYMRNMLLRDADQMSMATSLELRIPFLDHDLVEYVLQLPAREKLRHGGNKGLLVAACRDLLPESVYRRPKMGFGLPMDEWMRGPLATFVAGGVAQVRERGLVRAGYLDGLADGFRFRKVHWTRLWTVSVLGHYLENVGAAVSVDGALLCRESVGRPAEVG